mmetsp:Transcript_100/g.299  ORF Transcript_100/g.299 Transcript_100/m.299 type:complete len:204 (-) Transcript_100:597-1208(-)
MGRPRRRCSCQMWSCWGLKWIQRWSLKLKSSLKLKLKLRSKLKLYCCSLRLTQRWTCCPWSPPLTWTHPAPASAAGCLDHTDPSDGVHWRPSRSRPRWSCRTDSPSGSPGRRSCSGTQTAGCSRPSCSCSGSHPVSSAHSGLRLCRIQSPSASSPTSPRSLWLHSRPPCPACARACPHRWGPPMSHIGPTPSARPPRRSRHPP